MTIKNGFILRSIADCTFLVKLLQDDIKYVPSVELNEMGAHICRLLMEGLNKKEVLETIAGEYEVAEEELKRDLESFFSNLERLGFIVEGNDNIPLP